MATKNQRAWAKYGIDGATDHDAIEFENVYHTAHLRDAVRIFEDGVIRSSLVWDESILRNSRTVVAWVSPNTWAYGSIYGSIQLAFPWEDLVDDRLLYWVEGVDRYNPPAYRILVSHRRPDKIDLPPYSPVDQGGPIFLDKSSGGWFRNRRFTGEFLIDGDLMLERDCVGVDSVSHHPTYCRRYGSRCEFLDASGADIGARFISALIAAGATMPAELFLQSDKALRGSIRAACATILRRIDRMEAAGKLRSDDPSATNLATAILHRIGRDGLGSKGASRLGGLFRSAKELSSSVETRLSKAFGLRSLGIE